MPGYNCSIKERMLYSSCKNSVVEILEQEGIEIAKKIEVDDGKELTETFLLCSPLSLKLLQWTELKFMFSFHLELVRSLN